MAVTFTTTFLVGSLALGYFTSHRGALAAAAFAGLMLAAALAMLTRAKRDLQRLTQRRDELERRLGRRHS
jgi:membrane associated rhomboid family serine protease